MLASLSTFSLAVNIYYGMNKGGWISALISLFSLLAVAISWWRDVIRESTFQGFHTKEVCKGLYLGVILFIISEVMFFFSFFFSYFFLSLNSDIEIGCTWPPVGVVSVPFSGVPLFNTLLLLSSGVSVTWAHHSILSGKKKDSVIALFITVILGGIFSFFQYKEYVEISFTFADSVFGSIFFLMTGFHGIHVIIGSLFLFLEKWRLMLNHFSSSHHLGFEASAWYWHFVDVVWLGLFLLVYWWGS